MNNGNYYIGQLLNGKMHGKGIKYYKKDKINYDGEFVNDRREGNGNILTKIVIIILGND